MKRLYRPGVEELGAIPEGEWVEVVGGLKFRWVDEKVHVRGRELVVPLPANVRKKFRAKEGEVLRARIKAGAVVVQRSPRKKTKQTARP
jgi:hypothetical protein